ncbi:helix-turn-helix domain-containing protein [Paenibacillus sp.]|uniref:helix-turn-helix domain-containing protein n=1 Tax=Paenibacillus sp. TaxID=58172 RepID=UPI00283945EA|nr:helix-turn-helix domain-containing protein [Paenibacillus sp.]MDR0268150.1 helix-turn-helix domain-containing protein [Paenibacillus sp.]
MEASIIRTIGELIHDTRCTLNITLTRLSELSGIHKGTISRIENGNVKRPEFQTILPLATVLQIPFETLIDYYVEIETRSDHLKSMYETALSQGSSIEQIRKVAAKYLESNEDSLELTEKLFQSISSIEDTFIKLTLYDLIIDYSLSHGIMPYIARGMYHKYLIERDDFNRLKETYYSGKNILNYVNFLPQEEQIELFYKLGVHAYNLRFYHESIEHCKGVLKYDGENLHKVNSLVILRDAYFHIEDYAQSEHYSTQYKQFSSCPLIRENIVLMEAVFNAKKGNVKQTVELLSEFLKTCSNDSAILATNQLLQLYLKQGNLKEVGVVLSNCKIDPSLISNNPFVYAKYADFLKLQGDYYLAVGDYEKSVNCLLEGALYYSKVDDTVNARGSQLMIKLIQENDKKIDIEVVKKIQEIFDQYMKDE